MTFGSLDEICVKTGLPLCSLLTSKDEPAYLERGIVPQCYSRAVELANTTIFQVGNAFVHFGGLAILVIILLNVKSKYTAIGRTEMLSFFYLMVGVLVSSLIVDCGVSPPGSSSYAYFVSAQIGLAAAACSTLLYNGLLCFQFWEDGTKTSIWTLRVTGAAWFAVNFLISLITFKSWHTSLNSSNTLALFIVCYVLNAIILFFYVVSQIVLVVFALDSYWPLGAISLGVFFFVAGQVLQYAVSVQICEGAGHYVDGLFLGSVCNVFTVMMIYKFWDMITTDDLEFSVANVDYRVQEFGEDEKRNSMIF